MKTNKYRNKKTIVGGITFDSKKEARRYDELRLLEKVGEIKEIETHPKFDLVINGKKIGRYTADFKYLEHTRDNEFNEIIEDVKSKPTMTEAFSLRRRVFEACYPGKKIRIIK